MNLPVTQLQKTDRQFTRDPSTSYTLPARFYTDEAIYEQEKEAIFYRSWMYAGHISQLASPGDYFTLSIHNQSVFIVRDKSGEINGFYNVCQHRGHELLTNSGRTRLIVCPYHAWSYDLNGQLRSARNSDNVDGFDKCEFALKTIRVEIFCGMIFVNLDADAESLAIQAAGLEEEIREVCPRVDELVFAQRDPYDVQCNWKVIVDNFLECYHCDPAHKDFVDLVDMGSYRSTVKGIYSSHVSKAARSTDNTAFKFDKGDVDFGYAGWFLWPNLTIWIYPGEANMSILQMNPGGLERTVEYQDWFIPSTTPSRQLKDAMDYQKDILQPEDIALCESVQRGLRSKGYNQGRFIVDRDKSELSEHAVHHFQAMVAEALGMDVA